jgi:hypothetical protein
VHNAPPRLNGKGIKSKMYQAFRSVPKYISDENRTSECKKQLRID